MNIAEKLIRLKQDFDNVFKAGKNAQQDNFWDIYQGKGGAKGYGYAFAGNAWKDDIYTPKYDIVVNYTAAYMYYDTRITDTKIVIDLASGAGSRSTSNMFNAASNLKTIKKLIVSETTPFVSSTFQNCTSLQNIEIEGTIGVNGFDIHWSKDLTAESIDSIVRALSTTTSGLTITLPYEAWTTHALEYGAPNTNELWESRSNWTINELMA